MSEKMNPDEVVHMLNEYMTEMVKIIQKHKGVVDKYVGDAIMALWGVPEANPMDAAHCVQAALEMREALIKLNHKRKLSGKSEIKIGIGIHTGQVLAGNIGSDERLEYTVIGDTVNQASRIESANKECQSDILISDTTYSILQDQKFSFGEAIEIKVKGKSEKIKVYQVLGTLDASGNLKTVLSKEAQEKALHPAPPHQVQDTRGQTFVPTQMVVPAQGGASIPMAFPELSQNAPSPMVMTHAGQVAPPPATEYWYLVRDPNTQQVEGPFSVNQLKVIAAQVGFNLTEAHVFKDGDLEMISITEMPGFSRRTPPRPQAQPAGIPLPSQTIVRQAGHSEWYVYGSDTKTYGPYSIQQLEHALSVGNLTRTTYVWRQGMQNWMYLYQVPGFDRRGDGTPQVA